MSARIAAAFGVLLAAACASETYSPVSQSISELGASGAANGALVSLAGFAPTRLSVLAFLGLAVVSHAGFVMGIVVARPLERSGADFDPRSASVLRKTLRWALCAALVMATLTLLELAFATVSADDSALGISLRYVRYAMAAVAGMLVAPLLFVKLGWAERMAAVAGVR